MKQQVTDISQVSQDMVKEMLSMCGTIDSQYADNLRMNRNLDALRREIPKKDEEIVRLKEHLAKYENLGKNSDNSNTPPSQGSMVNWVKEAKMNTRPAIDKIKECIMSSVVIGFDESGCYCGKRIDWAWIAQTVYYTLLFCAEGKGSRGLADRFGDSLERMTAVTDRHSAYFVLHFLNHQVCLAHLLRELQYLSELDTGQDWSEKSVSL